MYPRLGIPQAVRPDPTDHVEDASLSRVQLRQKVSQGNIR